MKKLQNLLAGIALIMCFFLISCERTELTPNVNEDKFTLRASVPTSTKITYVDELTEGISLTWQSSDKFSVFNVETGAWVADFELSGDVGLSTSNFVKTEGEDLVTGVNYKAAYPVRPNTECDTWTEYEAQPFFENQVQTGATLGHLNSSCLMIDEFTSDVDVEFEHQTSIISATFTTPDNALPKEAYFAICDNYKSKVVFTAPVDNAGLYTVYFAVMKKDIPALNVSSYYNITVVYGEDKILNYTKNINNPLIAGFRYTLTVDNDAAVNDLVAIKTADELISYIENPNGNAILLADIDMTDKTIKHSPTPYNNTFNGNGYKISNVVINSVGVDNLGLFRWTNNLAKVLNLSVDKVSVTGNNVVGVITGRNGGLIENCIVTNAKIIANSTVGIIAGNSTNAEVSNVYVSGTLNTNGGNVGGIVGYNDNSKILNSRAVEVHISSAGGNVGGIVGATNNSLALVDNCTIDDSSEIISTGEDGIGGIAGKASKCKVLNSTSSATINSEAKNTGGVVGYIEPDVTVKNCKNMGNISSKDKNTGGIAGTASANSEILLCENNGQINAAPCEYVGGIVGASGASISGCHNNAVVNGKKYVGGLAGSFSGTITVSYNSGELPSAIRVGGLVGDLKSTAILSGCYNTGTVGAHNQSGGIAGNGDRGYLIDQCYSTNDTDKEKVPGIIVDLSEIKNHMDDMNTAARGYTVYRFESIDDNGKAVIREIL